MPRLFRGFDTSTDASGPLVLTSMTDIVFLLMIFLLFAPLGRPEGQLLATAGSGEGSNAERVETVWIMIRIGSDGRPLYQVDDRPAGADRVSLGRAVRAKIAESDRPTRVVLDAGEGTTFEMVVAAWDESLKAGARDLAMLE